MVGDDVMYDGGFIVLLFLEEIAQRCRQSFVKAKSGNGDHNHIMSSTRLFHSRWQNDRESTVWVSPMNRVRHSRNAVSRDDDVRVFFFNFVSGAIAFKSLLLTAVIDGSADDRANRNFVFVVCESMNKFISYISPRTKITLPVNKKPTKRWD